MAKETEAQAIPQLRQVFRLTKAQLDNLMGLRDGALGFATDETILYRQSGDGAANWEAITTLGAILTIAETEVYHADSPNAWTDLDLSGFIGGAKATLVILKVHNVGAGGIYFGFRRNGDTDDVYMAVDKPLGASTGYSQSTVWTVIVVPTDAAGIVEWRTDIVTDHTIDLIAYLN